MLCVLWCVMCVMVCYVISYEHLGLCLLISLAKPADSRRYAWVWLRQTTSHVRKCGYLLKLHRSAIIVLTTNGLLMIINHLEPAIISHLACLIVS